MICLIGYLHRDIGRRVARVGYSKFVFFVESLREEGNNLISSLMNGLQYLVVHIKRPERDDAGEQNLPGCLEHFPTLLLADQQCQENKQYKKNPMGHTHRFHDGVVTKKALNGNSYENEYDEGSPFEQTQYAQKTDRGIEEFFHVQATKLRWELDSG